jgi:NAD(P)H dehydrogenase (quinone)
MARPLQTTTTKPVRMSQKILITGASGHFGGGVLDHLLGLMPADRLIAMARDPQKLQRFADKGVEVRQGD